MGVGAGHVRYWDGEESIVDEGGTAEASAEEESLRRTREELITEIIDRVPPRGWNATVWRGEGPVEGRLDGADVRRLVRTVLGVLEELDRGRRGRIERGAVWPEERDRKDDVVLKDAWGNIWGNERGV